MALKVVGAGFGRTGTLSLKNALEKLGVGPCYHMMEVFPRPEHVAMWHRLAFENSMDWDLLFRDFHSTVDWPSARWWREIAAHYPEAKVLLSVRDPEAWYKSMFDTIYQPMTWPVPENVPEATARVPSLRLTIPVPASDETLTICPWSSAAMGRRTSNGMARATRRPCSRRPRAPPQFFEQ